MNRAIYNFIDDNKKLFVELETMLSGIPAISPLSGGEGEYKKVHALEDWLRSKGFDDFTYINAPDEKAFNGVRPSLILTIPGKKTDRNFWIMSHVDVVPPGDLKLWNSDPFKVVEKNGRLYGRGVEDNQHGLCASVMAALAVKESGLQPEYTVKLLFVADEEVGSVYGINYIMDKYPDLFSSNDYALVPDSGWPSDIPAENSTALPVMLTARSHPVSRRAANAATVKLAKMLVLIFIIIFLFPQQSRITCTIRMPVCGPVLPILRRQE